jgi:hypothetical protein
LRFICRRFSSASYSFGFARFRRGNLTIGGRRSLSFGLLGGTFSGVGCTLHVACITADLGPLENLGRATRGLGLWRAWLWRLGGNRTYGRKRKQ